MAKDPIKKADNGTYYFRANLGYNPITGKQIQKYRSGFRTKKEAKEEYSKLVLASTEELTTKKDGDSFQQFIEETYLPWYKTQVKESTYLNRATTIKKHFSYFYKMETNEIEPIHVQNWQLKLAKDFSPNYIRIVQGMLSIAFDRAIVLGIAKKNPSRMIGNSDRLYRGFRIGFRHLYPGHVDVQAMVCAADVPLVGHGDYLSTVCGQYQCTRINFCRK